MEILTPEEKQKEKKLYRNMYIFLAILPIIALLTVMGYFMSQKSLATQANDAIRAGNIEEAKSFAILLDSWETQDKNHETVLMVACENGCSEIIEWALAHNADPNYAPDGAYSPLELYCSFGFRGGAKTLSRLLRAGADVTNYKYTPPIFCLAEKLLYMSPAEREITFEEMLLLYNKGDKIRHNGTTLLHYAAQYDAENLAMALLQTAAGARQLAEKNEEGKLPAEVALDNGSAKVQRLFRKFEEGLLAELDKEQTPPEEDDVIDTNDELDALINSLYEQSSQNQETTPSEPIETEETND